MELKEYQKKTLDQVKIYLVPLAAIPPKNTNLLVNISGRR